MEEFVKTYIESGVLELYALGALNQQEQLDVEAMLVKHPDVRHELQEIESSLQQYAEENSVEPSEKLKQRVINSLVTNLADDRTFNTHSVHQEAEARIVTLPGSQSKNIFYKYAFAASLVLLCLSLAALIVVYKSLQRAQGQLVSLQLQNEHYSKTVQFKDTELEVYRSNAFKLITLKGLPKSPASSLTMAWNPSKKKVMISTARMDLPKNDAQHQYQLWALVKGKPIDLGVFDARADSTDHGMIEMKSIANADAFAVTLEPRGGSASPTLSEMMVMAKL